MYKTRIQFDTRASSALFLEDEMSSDSIRKLEHLLSGDVAIAVGAVRQVMAAQPMQEAPPEERAKFLADWREALCRLSALIGEGLAYLDDVDDEEFAAPENRAIFEAYAARANELNESTTQYERAKATR